VGLLSSLLEAWDSLVMAVSNSCGTGTLKFDDVVGVLLGEEACRKPSGSAETSGSVLSVDRRGRSRNRDKKKMGGRNFVGQNLGILLPNSFMLDREVTSLSIYQTIWRHTYQCFEGCLIGP